MKEVLKILKAVPFLVVVSGKCFTEDEKVCSTTSSHLTVHFTSRDTVHRQRKNCWR